MTKWNTSGGRFATMAAAKSVGFPTPRTLVPGYGGSTVLCVIDAQCRCHRPKYAAKYEERLRWGGCSVPVTYNICNSHCSLLGGVRKCNFNHTWYYSKHGSVYFLLIGRTRQSEMKEESSVLAEWVESRCHDINQQRGNIFRWPIFEIQWGLSWDKWHSVVQSISLAVWLDGFAYGCRSFEGFQSFIQLQHYDGLFSSVWLATYGLGRLLLSSSLRVDRTTREDLWGRLSQSRFQQLENAITTSTRKAILPKIGRLPGKRSTLNELENKKPAPPNLSNKVSLMYTVVQSWHKRLQTSSLALSLGIESLAWVGDYPRVLIEVNATRIPSSASKQGFIKGPFLRAKDCAQHQTC